MKIRYLLTIDVGRLEELDEGSETGKKITEQAGKRIAESATEAITEALRHAENRGFNHPMRDETFVTVDRLILLGPTAGEQERIAELLHACKQVWANWEKGDLAGAVNNLRELVEEYEATMGMSKEEGEPDYWSGDEEFPPEDWQYEVANGDTRLGYWQWVKQKKESKAGDVG